MKCDNVKLLAMVQSVGVGFQTCPKRLDRLNPDEPEPKRRLSVVTVEDVQNVQNVETVYDYNDLNEQNDTTA